MTLFWGRVECEAAVGSNVRSVPSVLQGNVPCGKTVTVGIDSPYRSGCFLRPWVKSM